MVVIPGDVLQRERSAPPLALGYPSILRRWSVHRSKELRQAADILNRAQKVTILGGAGCQGAQMKLVAVAARLKAPIVHAMRGKEFIEFDNPYDVGMTGCSASPPATRP